MRRVLPLLLIFSLVMPACSGSAPAKSEAQPPLASLAATATAPLFESPVVADTPTPTLVDELVFSLTITPTLSLAATPTLTPTLTTSPNQITTGLATQPPLMPTQAPEKSRSINRDKGADPCT
jgi:hypothetical protein